VNVVAQGKGSAPAQSERKSNTPSSRTGSASRVGVRVGESVAGAKAAFEEVVRGACPEAEISWGGGKFAPAETPTDHPLVEVVGTALAEELGQPAELSGFSGGADMRLFTARGIPCVMVGTNGIELAHAVNERVSVEDVYKLARVLARSLVQLQFGDEPHANPKLE
jgi:acetylornithine deacetylase